MKKFWQNPCIFLVLIAFGFSSIPSKAAIIRIPGDRATIQEGINIAGDLDTVLVSSGTYSGAGNHKISFLGKKILVVSESGPAVTHLLTDDTVRTIVFDENEDSLSILDGFTITGGYDLDIDWAGQFRGGISISNASPIIRNCIITGCFAESGGGVFIIEGKPIISNCVITNNYSTRRGAGVMSASQGTHIINSDISNNSIRCTANTWLATGGGIRNQGILNLDNCTIRNNRVVHISSPPSNSDMNLSQGGGIYSLSGALSLDSCVISGNFAGQGGAVLSGLAEVSVSGSLFFNNTASSFAGILNIISEQNIYAFESQNCTYACNYSAIISSDGIALANKPTMITGAEANSDYPKSLSNNNAGILIKNNIFAFNSSFPIYLDVGAPSYNIVYNNLWHTVSGSHYGGILPDLTGLDGNISDDPLFCEMNDTGLYLDVNSACANGGENGGPIGAQTIGCNNLSRLPEKLTVFITDSNNSDGAMNQLPLDDALELIQPWDTLKIISDSQSVAIVNLQINIPIYLTGSAEETNEFVLTKDYTSQNRSVLTLNNFCVIENMTIEAYHYGGQNQGYTAISSSDFPSIIFQSQLTAYQSSSAVSFFNSSPLLRNCDITNGLSAIGAKNIVASYNYWYCEDNACINDALQIDSLLFTGEILYEPFLSQIPTGIEQHETAIPDKIKLFQNHPNPFNAGTVIGFYLEKAGMVEFNIYNILGECIRSYSSSAYATGKHQIFWNGKNGNGDIAASGIYYYQIIVNGVTKTRSMVLVK